jgi:hypothetical protein
MALIDRTNWTALVDDDGSNLVGTIVTKDKLKTVLLDPIDAAFGSAASTPSTWTPTFGAEGGGTITLSTALGTYEKRGKIVTAAGYCKVGSVASPLAGLQISLPLAVSGRSAATVVFAAAAAGLTYTTVAYLDAAFGAIIRVQGFAAGNLTGDVASKMQANTECWFHATYFTP